MIRRTFIQAAASAAAAAAAGRIRIGMIGVKHSHASGKLKAMLDSGLYDVAGVAEPDAEARARAARSPVYQGVRWMDEEALLADASVQAVAVEGDVWENFARGRRVIAAGKHLHLEKPPCDEMAPFRELIETARARKLLVQVGYIWRHHAGIEKAFAAAREGRLGEVYMLRGVINTDHEPAARQPLARYKGGMMFELGSHLIDRVVDLWGRPRDVRAFLRHDTAVADRLADNTLAVLEYERSIAMVSSAARMAGSGPHRSLELLGTEGSIVIQPIEPGVKLRMSTRAAGWKDIEMPPQPRYAGDMAALAQAIRTGSPLRHSYEHELAVQETLLRACGAGIA